MTLNGRTESGAEEWSCPDCGRRMLLRWPPHYEKLVLEHGDPTAIHVGGKGGVRASAIAVAQAPSNDLVAQSDVPSTERQWLRDIGIDWGGTSA